MKPMPQDIHRSDSPQGTKKAGLNPAFFKDRRFENQFKRVLTSLMPALNKRD